MSLDPPLPLPASDRVALTLPDTEDPRLADLVREASADPLIPLISSVPDQWSPEAAAAWVKRQQGRPAEGLGWSLTIEGDGAPVGNLFVSLALRDLGCASLGYWVVDSGRRRGFAAEAVELARDWAIDALGLERLTLWIDPDNQASLGVAAKTGFTTEDTFPGWERVGPERRPMVQHGYGGTDRHRDLAIIGLAEHRMWTGAYRYDREWCETMFHSEFAEIGRSGRWWLRDELLEPLVDLPSDPPEIDVELPLRDLSASWLSPADGSDAALVQLMYRSVEGRGQSLRSSLWVRDDHRSGHWRLRWHQGTPIPD